MCPCLPVAPISDRWSVPHFLPPTPCPSRVSADPLLHFSSTCPELTSASRTCLSYGRNPPAPAPSDQPHRGLTEAISPRHPAILVFGVSVQLSRSLACPLPRLSCFFTHALDSPHPPPASPARWPLPQVTRPRPQPSTLAVPYLQPRGLPGPRCSSLGHTQGREVAGKSFALSRKQRREAWGTGAGVNKAQRSLAQSPPPCDPQAPCSAPVFWTRRPGQPSDLGDSPSSTVPGL